jgi:hypothetical protein
MIDEFPPIAQEMSLHRHAVTHRFVEIPLTSKHIVEEC